MGQQFLQYCLADLVLLPAAVLVYLPVMHQCVLPRRRLVPYVLGLAVLGILAMAALQLSDLNAVTGMAIISVALFFVYKRTVKVSWSVALAVYTMDAAMMSFPASYTYYFDAWLNHQAGPVMYSPQALLFQLGMSAVFVAALYPLIKTAFTPLVDQFLPGRVWLSTVPVSVIMAAINLLFKPDHYEDLFSRGLLVLTALLVLYLFLCVCFHTTAAGALEQSRAQERLRFLQMQETQVAAMAHHMKETSRLRHDFRHNLRALQTLADEGDLDALRQHLDEYVARYPKQTLQRYCNNHTVNSLLNYYAAMAEEDRVRMDWRIDLPADLGGMEIDLCSLLGNLLENALTGCRTVEEGRFIALTTTIKNGVNLYIIATNSFDGKVRRKGGEYLSTKHRTRGMGLQSVALTAERYGGVARFHHEGGEFFADVMLRLDQNPPTNEKTAL